MSKQTTTSRKGHQGVYRLTRSCRSRWKKHRTKYAYDDENRLVSAQPNTGGSATTFVYDGLGRLREQLQWQTNNGSIGGGGSDALHGGIQPFLGGSGTGWTLISGIYYIYDGNRVIQERDTNNAPTVSYTRGKDLSGTLEGAGGIGGLLARSDTYSAGHFSVHNYYHADGNGNIMYLETSAQGLAASYRYDPFGNLLNSSGTYASANTYRFSSKEWIPSVNGYYYLYRFYRPDLQRWLNRDPIQEWGGINLYGFVRNNSVNEIDSFGFEITGKYPSSDDGNPYNPPKPPCPQTPPNQHPPIQIITTYPPLTIPGSPNPNAPSFSYLRGDGPLQAGGETSANRVSSTFSNVINSRFTPAGGGTINTGTEDGGTNIEPDRPFQP